MQNKKIISYMLVSFSVLLSLIFFNEPILSFTGNIELSLLVGIAAIASGVSGILMSMASRRGAVFEAIREYYQQGDTSQMIAARQMIYEMEDRADKLAYLSHPAEWSKDQVKAASELCSFFHFWGMMVRKGYLPLWIFKSASGPSIVRLFHLLQHYIEERRRKNNQYYAVDFEFLTKQIEKKYRFSYTLEKRRKSRRKKKF